jgi:hypothetical protein
VRKRRWSLCIYFAVVAISTTAQAVKTTAWTCGTDLEAISDAAELRETLQKLMKLLSKSNVPKAEKAIINKRILRFLSQEDIVKTQILNAGRGALRRYKTNFSAAMTGAELSTAPTEVAYLARKLKEIPDLKKFIDVGSGHGIPLILLALEFPDVQFEGYELVRFKVVEARKMAERLGLTNVHFRNRDFGKKTFLMPEADVYYFYNPSKADVVHKVALQITAYSLRGRRKITVFNLHDDYVPPQFARLGWKQKRLRFSEFSIFERAQ